MIRLTRLNGTEFSLNPDLIHRAEETPDTVLTLIDGSRYVVTETLDQLLDRVVGYRARVVAEAGRIAEDETPSRHHRPTRDVDDVHDDDPPASGSGVVSLRSRRA